MNGVLTALLTIGQPKSTVPLHDSSHVIAFKFALFYHSGLLLAFHQIDMYSLSLAILRQRLLKIRDTIRPHKRTSNLVRG